MNLIFLIAGTILMVIFIVLLWKGSKYDQMLDVLEGEEFPFRTIYGVGFIWQECKAIRLRGKLGDQLRENSTLYYSKKYSEYYARIAWAQILSFSHFFLAVFLVVSGLAAGTMSMFFFIVGIVVVLLVVYYFSTYTKGKIKERREECESEFPNAILKLALMVNSGVILHEAWKNVASGKDGTFYDLMKNSCFDMEHGKSEIDAIYDFGVLTNSDDIKKFTSALMQSIERGGGDLPQFLASQSSELWARKRQLMLQKGEKAAGALLMPIAMMFIGVMLIVISAAVQSFRM